METENQSENKRGWGGARRGAGRKKTTTASIALKIPADVEAILAAVPNRSAYIVAAIRHYHATFPDATGAE